MDHPHVHVYTYTYSLPRDLFAIAPGFPDHKRSLTLILSFIFPPQLYSHGFNVWFVGEVVGSFDLATVSPKCNGLRDRSNGDVSPSTYLTAVSLCRICE